MKNYLKKSLAIVSSIILSSSLGVFADGEGKEEPSASKSLHTSSEDIKQSLEDRMQKLEQEEVESIMNSISKEQKQEIYKSILKIHQLFYKWLTTNSSESVDTYSKDFKQFEEAYKFCRKNYGIFADIPDDVIPEKQEIYKNILKIQQLIFEYANTTSHSYSLGICLENIYNLISKDQLNQLKANFSCADEILKHTYDYIKKWDVPTDEINKVFEKAAKPLNKAMILYSGLENFEAAHITKLYKEGKIYDDHKNLKEWIKDEMEEDDFQELHNCSVFSKAMSHLYNLENFNIVYQFEEIPECRKDFISTTTDLKTAMKFAYWFSKESENMVILKINVPENSNVEMLAIDYMTGKYTSTDQYEFVLKGDERFKIKGITEKEMTYIKPHTKLQCREKFTIIEADLLPREK